MTRATDDAHTASQVDLQRPWKCSKRTAVYCPLHHDCECRTPREVNTRCPLHGADTTHPNDERWVR